MVHNGKNKKRNDMNGEKVIDLLWEVKEGKKHPNKAYKELCVLDLVSKCLPTDKEIFEEAQKVERFKPFDSDILQAESTCSALDDLKKQLEIEKEDKERNKDNMFISTFQDGKVEATKKAIDIIKGYCN